MKSHRKPIQTTNYRNHPTRPMVGEGKSPASQKYNHQETQVDYFAGTKSRFCLGYWGLLPISHKRDRIGRNWFLLVAFWPRKSDLLRLNGIRRATFEAKNSMRAMGKIQKLWTESTERGFRELSRRRPEEAARRWLEAEAILPVGLAVTDPIQAAAQSNAGASRLLLGHDHEAAARLASAEQSWREVIAGIPMLDVPMTGASSSFHFRLASAVPHNLIEARRHRYRRLAEVALAVTQFNRAFIDRRNASSVISRQAFALRPMFSEVLGAASPEVRLLWYCEEARPSADVIVIYADKHSEITSRPPTFAAALSNECAELESAVALTALLAPPVFTLVRRSNSAEDDDRNMDVGA